MLNVTGRMSRLHRISGLWTGQSSHAGRRPPCSSPFQNPHSANQLRPLEERWHYSPTPPSYLEKGIVFDEDRWRHPPRHCDAPLGLERGGRGARATDPPYNLQIGHVTGRGKVRHREFAMASGEMSEAALADFLDDFIRLVVKFSRNGAIHFLFMDWRHMRVLLNAADPHYSELKNVLVWNKTNAGQGSFYRSKHELIAVFKNGTAAHINNFGLGGQGRYRTNVLDYPGVNSLHPARRGDLELHPTTKPVGLIADLIRDCSRRNGIILDPFGGGGTTILAAERTGRVARVIELDPLYSTSRSVAGSG
jgi:DNA methylase